VSVAAAVDNARSKLTVKGLSVFYGAKKALGPV